VMSSRTKDREKPGLKAGFISLGCAKNQVDTEIMIGLLKRSGYKIVSKVERADIVVINTCGFIDAAKEEAIDNIIATGKLKTAGQLRYLVATGCLAQRYGQELLAEMPELDGVIGISHFPQIDEIMDRIVAGKRVLQVSEPPQVFIEKGPRVLTTPPGSAYLKITEGCNNRCTYCAIPSIRGRLRSKLRQEAVQEASELAKRGVRELVVVGQDTALYGADRTGKSELPDLLQDLSGVEGLEWIRLMYLHPAHIDDKIVAAVSCLPKVLPYLDIPIQHAADPILLSMNRNHTQEHLRRLLAQLRAEIDQLVLRTTVMLGFPGETEQDFLTLKEFLAEARFDWLGAFAFNAEEGTPACDLPDQLPAEVKQERLDAILDMQQEITREKNIARLDQVTRVLVSSRPAPNLYLGRSYFQAPEVDGLTLIKTDQHLTKGDFVEVQIRGIRKFDVIGEPLDEYTK